MTDNMYVLGRRFKCPMRKGMNSTCQDINQNTRPTDGSYTKPFAYLESKLLQDTFKWNPAVDVLLQLKQMFKPSDRFSSFSPLIFHFV